MNRVAALLLVATVSFTSGCGLDNVLCTAGSSGDSSRCPSSGPRTSSTSHDDDSDPTAGIMIAGAVIATAIIIGLVMHKSSEPPPLARLAPPRPTPVAVIAPSPNGSDRDQLLQRMYVQGYLSASTGKCEATVAIGNRLADLSPSYHDRYVGDPTIASCLTRR
jgi:hypothetical protein